MCLFFLFLNFLFLPRLAVALVSSCFVTKSLRSVCVCGMNLRKANRHNARMNRVCKGEKPEKHTKVKLKRTRRQIKGEKVNTDYSIFVVRQPCVISPELHVAFQCIISAGKKPDMQNQDATRSFLSIYRKRERFVHLLLSLLLTSRYTNACLIPFFILHSVSFILILFPCEKKKKREEMINYIFISIFFTPLKPNNIEK